MADADKGRAAKEKEDYETAVLRDGAGAESAGGARPRANEQMEQALDRHEDTAVDNVAGVGATKLLPLHIVTGQGRHPHHYQKRIKQGQRGQRARQDELKPLVRPAITEFLDSLRPPILWRFEDANSGRIVIDAKVLTYWLKTNRLPY
jgi:hypothetical protein